ncbi:MAG: DNA topoisomerase IV subunit A [Lentisphaeria bacterium]
MSAKKHNQDPKKDASQASKKNPETEVEEAAETGGGNGNGQGRDVPFASLVNDSLGDMMSANFIEYASYVIKDRAIPDLEDGLKPVQRRILHALREMDDGRFHKVANVIGQTMQYHPHGDASIGNALVVLANKEYFIEKQGNFGNILTGDDASAPRYIECRLSPLARDVMFNKQLTDYAPSYDGRKNEPITLPAKIPVTLLLGADGIAVGMSTRILPHNFSEVLKAQIAALKGKSFKLYPDFLTGGVMDASEYDNGNGKVKVRAKIETVDQKTLVIRELPATSTTESLISSIEEAARRGKLKLSSINDFTTDKPEIEIKLPRGIYAEDTIKRLYAYTNCEISLSTSMVIIRQNRPEILSVEDILRYCTEKLLYLLKRELEIELDRLHDSFHEKTLAQIFIENRIYKRIEEAETFEKVMQEVREGLEPYRERLKRDIVDDDIVKLLEIRIRRISRFDIEKNQKELQEILEQIEQVNYNLENLNDYTIQYLKDLLKKYGKQFPRRTEIQELEDISAREVALENVKVGHDKVNHFVGSQVKSSNKNEEPLICTEFDRLVLLRNNGKIKVIKVPEKEYIGPVKYLYKADKDQIYCLIYRDKKTGKHYIKRFKLDSYIMNREYKAVPKNCIIENVYTNYGMVLRCEFQHKGGADPYLDLELDDVQMRSRGARGFKISDRKIASFTIIKRGSVAPPEPGEGETSSGYTENDNDNESGAPGKKAKEEAKSQGTDQGGGQQHSAGSADVAREWSERSAKAARVPGKKQAKADSVTGKVKPKNKASAESEKGTAAAVKKDSKRKAGKKANSKSKKLAGNKKATAKKSSTKARKKVGETPKAKSDKQPAEGQTKAKPSKKHIRIDEDTPFFLE